MEIEFIEKQAAIEAMKQLPHEYQTKEQRARTGGIAACQMVVRSLPPADVRAVRRGQWRKIGNNSDGTSDYECSACLGIMMHVPDDDEHPMVSFCSMCGADMRGG